MRFHGLSLQFQNQQEPRKETPALVSPVYGRGAGIVPKYAAGAFLFLATFFFALKLVVVLADFFILFACVMGLVWISTAIAQGRFRSWQEVTWGALGLGTGLGLVSALLIPYSKWF